MWRASNIEILMADRRTKEIAGIESRNGPVHLRIDNNVLRLDVTRICLSSPKDRVYCMGDLADQNLRGETEKHVIG